ncbi:MAG: hypothetical protein J5802_00125 [Butyrivibrio sp.]|nr:hypothetical protein [Butyrivibrio sp.]
MKKKTTTAIILATTMMFALMGCGAASTDTDSSSDAASVAEVDTDTNSDTESTETTDDTSSDSASADSSDAADTATASADDSFTYKGETFSILDDLQTTVNKIDAVGKPSPNSPIECEGGTKIYSYDETKCDSDFFMDTFINNGTLTVSQISLMGSNVKTSKGIGIGSTVEELTSAYGEPTVKADSFYNYEFDNCALSFDTKDGKVFVIYYFNLDFYNARVK